ncbi:MAG: fused MFS/spermidine synthase [Planctomycetaceae bacterium]|nr:fused MFS/spermidine synthase [Planctomycetales bacterium]MCB9923321.1 fused MFS/spermidine synthase [Planctomycetaceae bacterium]
MTRILRSSTSLWFATAVFVSAFLVFQVQPIISKTILPWFGGSPGVWTTCMLFFQLLLFAGYSYAHLLTRLLNQRRQGAVHFTLLLLALLVLPMTPGVEWKPDGTENPTLAILLILLANVGLPYFLLASTGPLLQTWFANCLPEASPYRLYSLSNIGSLAALISYPFLVEPALTTWSQGQIWSLLFCLFATVCGYLAACQFKLGTSRQASQRHSVMANSANAPTWQRYLTWLLFPAFASMLLLATTNHVCQDIAVIPFLWIVPLSLYLLTFIICFDREAWYSRRWCAGAGIVSLLVIHGIAFASTTWSMPIQLVAYFAAMFCTCMVCHGELVRTKPDAEYLTAFYLMSSAGGALGGLTIGLLCPSLFSTYLEMQICMLAAAVILSGVFLLDAQATWLGDSPARRAIGTLAYCFVFIVVAFVEFGGGDNGVTKSMRNFYGVLQVAESPWGTNLIHGRILHGFQFSHPGLQKLPTTYYGEESGVGLTLQHLHSSQPIRVGAVGLGVGTVATYGKSGDYFRFYEINPTVLDIATNDFSFLNNSRAETEVILGDARISMEREPSQQLDVLVLDAFSGDSIPTHLLTREAFAVYLRHLNEDGVIAVHISNKHVNLGPVVSRLSTELGLHSAVFNSPERPPQTMKATWVLMTRNSDFLAMKEINDHAAVLADSTNFPLWTDQYNNIVQLLNIY